MNYKDGILTSSRTKAGLAVHASTFKAEMKDIVKRALRATRESKRIEFKRAFEPSSPGDWCELIKDIVALANSGGGIILFGLDSAGMPSGESVEQVAHADPADIANKLTKYIGVPDFEVEALELKKRRHRLHAFLVSSAAPPHVFQRPGTYDVGDGKQKSAFAAGTIYFRHGAKSEPGNRDDIRAVIEREIDSVRKSWVSGVKQVVQAPLGSEIVTVQKAEINSPLKSVRAVKNSAATPVLLTRDASKATGTIYYEEVSEGIFDEINNVVDANRALAKQQKRFFLGQPVYYRIYAERQHVSQHKGNRELLLHTAVADFYAPGLFWMLTMPEEFIARPLLGLYRRPRNPQVHSLLRIAIILGDRFSQWLLGKLASKWGRHAQPPGFYWTFKEMVERLSSVDYRLHSARLAAKSRIAVLGDENIGVLDLLNDPSRTSALLSKACMAVFEGSTDTESRSVARNLDYLAYGAEVRQRGETIADAIISAVGNQQVGEVVDALNSEEQSA